MYNVDEIDYCSQFHQHFKSRFFADILLPKKVKSQTVCTGKLLKALIDKKALLKMLLKLTPGVNPLTIFTYVNEFLSIMLPYSAGN